MLTFEGVPAQSPVVLVSGLVWLFLYLLFAGIGSTFRYRYFGAVTRAVDLAWLDFWIGYAIATVFLQLVHLWLPIDGRALTVLMLAAVPGALRRAGGWNPRALLSPTSVAPFLTLAIATPWLAYRLTAPVSDGDTGLYHLQSVIWSSSFPIVPGLGNLHDRLAFNSVHHLYAALCDAFPVSTPSYRLANGPFFLVSLAQLVRTAVQPANSRWLRMRRHFSILMVGPVILQALTPQFHGLAPDFAVFALQLMFARLLLDLLQYSKDEHGLLYLFAVTPLLCAASISVKLSGAVFAFATCAVCLLQTVQTSSTAIRKQRLRTLGVGVIIASLGIAIWAMRGVILSGYPAYPVPFLSVPVEWRLPRPLVMDINYVIRSWARVPAAHWVDVLGSWEWVDLWLDKHWHQLRQPFFMVGAAIVVWAVALIRSRRAHLRALLFVMPAVVGLWFWFVTAPDLRFARGLIWITATGFVAIATDALLEARTTRLRLLIYFASSAAVMLSTLPFERFQPRRALPRSEVGQFTTRSGDHINHPTKRGFCWDAPLPCTPYERQSLRLRRQGDLGAGFVLDDPFECLSIHTCRPPRMVVSAGIGIELHRGEWRPYRKRVDRHWMNERARALLYVESARQVMLRLYPVDLGLAFPEPTLAASVDDGTAQERAVVLGAPVEFRLELRPGFNILTLEVVSDPPPPRPRRPWDPTEGRPAIGFASIEIVDPVDTPELW